MIELKLRKLDLGCGIKKQDGYIGIDTGNFKPIYPKDEFIMGNVFKILPSIKSGTVENIYSNQFIEHIPKDKFIPFMNQCWRILKVGGIFECIFPPAITAEGKPNGEFYADPLHVNAMLPGTFACFSNEYRKAVFKEYGTDYRGYGIKTNFDIVEAKFLNIAQVDIKLEKKK